MSILDRQQLELQKERRLRKPQQSLRLDDTAQTMKVMAGKYGDYPWNLSESNWTVLRAKAATSDAPEDLVSAIAQYDTALEDYRAWERALCAAPE